VFPRQVDTLVTPSQESISEVSEWLVSHGLKKEDLIFNDAKDYIKVTLPVKTAETLLDAKFSVYQHVKSDKRVTRALEYSLPRDIFEHLDFVQPTTMFAKIHETPKRKIFSQLAKQENGTEDAAAKCSGFGINLDCLKQYYNMNYTPSSPKSKLGVTGYLGEYASYADLTTFAKKFMGGVGATFTTQLGLFIHMIAGCSKPILMYVLSS
jgi:tripeptidyl-peptidase-1